MTNLEELKAIVEHGKNPNPESRFNYPPAIAKTLGLTLTQVDLGKATIVMEADPAQHANPMGTIHGGVLCDIADLAIGTAHATTLAEGESFTSVDLQINFFRPVFKEKIIAKTHAINSGKTLTRYQCDIVKEDGKLIAQVLSTVMTLRGNKAEGR
jgi:uncharacterized protein (TIGR00369 family)